MHPGPRTSQRIELLDMIRGFTLCGIALANVLWLSGLFESPARDRAPMLDRPSDEIVLFLIRVLVHGKFYYILAFLFGTGFAVQLERNPTADSVHHHVRRMLVLFALGVLHSLLWWGDILRYYALLGLTLLWFRRCTNRQLIIGVALLSVLPLALEYARWMLDPGYRNFHFVHIADRRWLSFQSTASTAELFKLNLLQIGDHFIANFWNGRFLKMLSMFLAGMLAGRIGLFQQPERFLPWASRIFWPALVIGGIGNLISVSFYYQDWHLSLHSISQIRAWIGTFSMPALSLFYLVCFLLVGANPHGGLYRRLRLLVPAGRMSLSLYVGQIIVYALIFKPYFGAYYAQLGVTVCALIALVTFAVQLLLSHWWLQIWRHGPLEWGWRCVSQGRWVPNRC